MHNVFVFLRFIIDICIVKGKGGRKDGRKGGSCHQPNRLMREVERRSRSPKGNDEGE